MWIVGDQLYMQPDAQGGCQREEDLYSTSSMNTSETMKTWFIPPCITMSKKEANEGLGWLVRVSQCDHIVQSALECPVDQQKTGLVVLVQQNLNLLQSDHRSAKEGFVKP